MGPGPEDEMAHHLRAWCQAELVQLAANFAACSRGRGMASIDKSLRPEAFGQVPDVGVGAARATRQAHFADQEAALQLHYCTFGRQLLRFFAQPGTTPEFPRRLRGMIEQPVIYCLGLAREPTIEIEPGHVPLLLQAAPGQSREKVGQIIR